MTIAIAAPGTAALTARVACDAILGTRTRSVDGWPKDVPVLCTQVIGLRSYLGADDRRHVYCASPDHEEMVRRRSPETAFRTAIERRKYVDGCLSCDAVWAVDGNGPCHDASRRCESGAHEHCSCETCF